MLELGDEHRGHTVEDRTVLLGHRLEHRGGVEVLGRDDERCPMCEASKVRDDHAEAVIEGHGDAQTVARSELEGLGNVKAVVQDVVMGQNDSLGEAGGAGSELDVDRVVRVEHRGSFPHRGFADLFAETKHFLPQPETTLRALCPLRVERVVDHHVFELGEVS